jgi:type IV pilus assembly protein PilA
VGRDLSIGTFGEDGFTLIELMVVLLILAILLAIAIPTFLGVTKSANDRAAQSNLNTSFVNAKSTFQLNSQSYALTSTGSTYVTTNAASLASTLASGNPSLSYATGAVTSGTSPATVSVAVAADGNGLVLATQAKGTSNCWYIIDNTAAESTTSNGPWSVTGIPTAVGTYYGEAKSATTCSAAAPVAVPTSNTPPTVQYQSSSFPNL